MPTIEISQEHYDRLMSFKPVLEQVLQEEVSDPEFADFVAFSAIDRLFLESAMSADYQLVEAIRKGDSAFEAAVNTLRNAQLTLQGLSRRHPQEVFDFIADVWAGMDQDEQRDKGMGLHVLWERGKQRCQDPLFCAKGS